MTSPTGSDAFSTLRSMLSGTRMLAQQPGVVTGLQSSGASPAEAGAVDQFLQGLDAQRQVNIARLSGQQIMLSPDQKQLLGGMGVNYADVEFSHQSAIDATVKSLESQGYTVARDKSGNVRYDKNGNLVLTEHMNAPGISGGVDVPVGGVQVQEGAGGISATSVNPVFDQPAPYKAKGIGRFFHAINNDVIRPVQRDVVDPALGGLARAYHVADYAVTETIPGAVDSNDFLAAQSEDMKALGYDPNNFFSLTAYMSSGKGHDPLKMSRLYKKYGQDKVNQAVQFLNDPEGAQAAISADTSLTPEQASDKIRALNEPEFKKIVRKVGGSRASWGDVVAGDIVDPAAHPKAFALISAGANLAASFAIDPTYLAATGVQKARMAQVGIDTLADANNAAKMLSPEAQAAHAAKLNETIPGTATAQAAADVAAAPARSGIFVNGVQRRWQGALDLAKRVREARAAGDEKAATALTGRFQAQYKELAPLLPDFTGANQIKGWATEIKDGKKVATPVYGAGEPIETLEQAAEYVASKVAFTRLMNGRAATQASLMPGAVSAFGYRRLKGLTAEWMTARSYDRAQNAYAKVLSAAEADPGVARKLLGDNIIEYLPKPDDAVNIHSDQVLATPEYGLTAGGRGKVQLNLRRYGNPLGEGGTLSKFTPTAIAARSRLAAQRFSTMLPRNTQIGINDAASGEKIEKIALTYLNRGDARLLRMQWDLGDGGTRKAILDAVVDQVGHAAGLGHSKSGQLLLDAAKTPVQAYAHDPYSGPWVNGSPIALHGGQTNEVWHLPTFRTLQEGAAKLGLWESTFGRVLTSRQADMIMGQWKLGALGKPSTVTRNQLEGWLRTALEGKAGSAIQAKAVATAPIAELAAKGYEGAAMARVAGLSQEIEKAERALEEAATPALQRTISARLEELNTEVDNILSHPMLSGQALGRSTPMHRMANFAPVALAGRAYRALLGKTMDDETVRALLTLGQDELAQALREYATQIREADLGFANTARQASEVAEKGYGPSTLRTSIKEAMHRQPKPDGKITGWDMQSTEGLVGADRYAGALARAVNKTPSVAHAILDHLEGHASIDDVIKAMDSPENGKIAALMGWGKYHWPGEGLRDGHLAVSPEEIAQGKLQWAQWMVDDYAHLLMGKDGNYVQSIVDHIRTHGKAPNGDWIHENVANDLRPETIIAPEIMAMAPGEGERGVAQALMDIEGAAYEWMVERPLHRTTSAPVFLANYAEARKGLNPYVQKLVDEAGIEPDAAAALAKELAIKNAWVKTEQLIDDPGQKSQFDIVARNIFPFSRATQAMIRRWGVGMYQDPARARKLMLAYEGATQSGLVYTNQFGEPTFTYPGSGAMDMALREVAKIPGLEGIARFPIASSMTGGVLMSVPGADNPFRMAAGPMITVPVRSIYNYLQNHGPFQQDLKNFRATFDEVDRAINGPVGQGETLTQFVPTAARKFYQALDDSEKNKALASATMGAIANLAAAGQVPPPDATQDEIDAFVQNVRTQVRSQLVLRAVFGMVAFAPPSLPTETTSASKADFSFHLTGIQNLKDEYRKILNDTGGDLGRANAIWTALHPDQVVYKPDGTVETKHLYSALTVGTSRSTTKGAVLPPTEAALRWLNENSDFVGKYKSVAAYFLPVQGKGEPFNEAAYRLQQELGLRVSKTPTEFYRDVRVRNAETVFYKGIDDLNQQILDARIAGDDATVSRVSDIKKQWSDQFKALNPLLAQKLASGVDGQAKAQSQLKELRQIVANGEAPPGTDGKLLGLLIKSYDGYEKFIHSPENTGGTDAAQQARSMALTQFNLWAEQHIAGTDLEDLYNGVFRSLNQNFEKFGGVTQ